MDVFDIRLHGFEDAPGRDPSEDLARAFGIDVAQARRIVARAPVVVKKGVPEDVAERFFRALRDIGAKVTIEKRVVASIAPPAAHAPPGHAHAPPAAPSFGAGGHAGAFDGRSLDIGPTGPPIDLDIDPVALASVRPPARFPSAHPAGGGSVPPAATVGVVPTAAVSASPRSAFPAPIEQKALGPFLPALLGAFAYPLKKQAFVVILGLAIVSQILSYFWIIGALLSAGVVAGYLFAIIRATHNDKDELPVAGDFTDTSDLTGPAIRFFLALVVPFAPAVALAFLLPSGGPAYVMAIVLAVLAGLVYMPASVIVAALGTGCLAPLNPVAGILIMTRVPGPYVLLTLAVGFVVMIDALVGIGFDAAAQATWIPFVPGVVARAIGLPFSFVAARMLGLFLRHYETELGLD
jgi:hypothetical protein